MGNGCKGRDAKVVARALRDALQANAIKITHSDRLELIAKAFGCENWNVLSAKIEATRQDAAGGEAADCWTAADFRLRRMRRARAGSPLPYRASINSRSRSTWAAIWAAS
jgi:hypothetical protein